jgi:hypothetical protein
MSFDAKRFFELLPAIYRIRDAQEGGQLQALLSVIAGQAGVLEEDLAQLYDDQFIETCASWVVPYIGDLIGYRALHGLGPTVDSPRAEVANTIAYRRRKGTASMLQQLARDVTGWDARVVEFFQLLGWAQHMNHARLDCCYAPDLRRWETLERLNTPFDSVAHTVDVHHINAGTGLYNIPSIGIFLWRLTAYSLTNSTARKLDDRRYLFSPLGNNTTLFTHPETEAEVTSLANPINVPMPIGRWVLDEYLDKYYGQGKSILINVEGVDVDSRLVEASDLSDTARGDWGHVSEGKIGIDPVLGRILFSANELPRGEVRVTYHYGFSDDIGGGEYDQSSSINTALAPVLPIAAPASIQAALNGVVDGGAAEVGDSALYSETLSIQVNGNRQMELRAANEHRPVLVLGGEMQISGGEASEVAIIGLLISGGALRVPFASTNKLARLRLIHCTLVPGLGLSVAGDPQSPSAPSLIVESPTVAIEIDHCIVGGLRIAQDARVRITSSIVDATDPSGIACAGPVGSDSAPGGSLQLVNTTLIGKVRAVAIELISDSILLARPSPDDTLAAVYSERTQAGCVRFSSLPQDSRVPRRYRCEPDLALAQRAKDLGYRSVGDLSSDEQHSVALRMRPRFTSLRYGDPGYCQLSDACPIEIRQGGHDSAEMGAFHDLQQPQRETDLRVRLDEYLRFELEAGIFHIT